MKNTKSAKIITLVIAVLLLAGAAVGIYALSSRNAENAGSGTSTETESAQQDAKSAPVAETDEGETDFAGDPLIRIEGGPSTMGSPQDERQREQDEVSHEATIDPFYVDPYEVRQGDHERIMGVKPSHFSGVGLPVENVTWYEAIGYCNRLSESVGLAPAYTVEGGSVSWDRGADGYRLLTEAEWEYVARAGTATIYNVGDQVHSDLVNFEGSYPYLIEENYVTHSNPDVVTSKNCGKTIVSFSSHSGTMFGDSVSNLSKMAQGAYVVFGYEFTYSSSDGDEISEWLAANGVPEQ